MLNSLYSPLIVNVCASLTCIYTFSRFHFVSFWFQYGFMLFIYPYPPGLLHCYRYDLKLSQCQWSNHERYGYKPSRADYNIIRQIVSLVHRKYVSPYHASWCPSSFSCNVVIRAGNGRTMLLSLLIVNVHNVYLLHMEELYQHINSCIWLL